MTSVPVFIKNRSTEEISHVIESYLQNRKQYHIKALAGEPSLISVPTQSKQTVEDFVIKYYECSYHRRDRRKLAEYEPGPSRHCPILQLLASTHVGRLLQA